MLCYSCVVTYFQLFPSLNWFVVNLMGCSEQAFAHLPNVLGQRLRVLLLPTFPFFWDGLLSNQDFASCFILGYVLSQWGRSFGCVYLSFPSLPSFFECLLLCSIVDLSVTTTETLTQ
jgi:hypothetical protein